MILPSGEITYEVRSGIRSKKQRSIVRLRDFLIHIRSYRELVAAIAHRELVEHIDGVIRDTNDRSAHCFEFLSRFRKLVRFNRAAFREGSGIEIKDYGTGLQRLRERKSEWLPRKRRLGS